VILVDAGPLVALIVLNALNRARDRHHEKCKSAFGSLPEPLGTLSLAKNILNFSGA